MATALTALAARFQPSDPVLLLLVATVIFEFSLRSSRACLGTQSLFKRTLEKDRFVPSAEAQAVALLFRLQRPFIYRVLPCREEHDTDASI
jgi:hypothetical protein